jgi:acyl-CoA synthetase (AMP-forming)/AMP-acid ligase II
VIEQEGINYMFMVPTLLNSIVHDPSLHGRDFSQLKAVLVASSPIADDTALRARKVLGPVLYQMYGQTECQPATFMGPDEWFAQLEGSVPLRSAGRPLPFAGLEIRDPDGAVLPPGHEGEIAIRCEGQMDGYWQEPELSRERLVDGWVLTGDVGRIDDRGYVYILDRKDDMIISGGFNIWPAELENAIASQPGVIEAAVFGIPHERWGETPMAVCVVDALADVSESDIVARCSEALGSHKKPTVVRLETEPLPKSAVGKIQRRALREAYWGCHDRQVSGA